MNCNDRRSLNHLVKSDDNVAKVREILATGMDPNLEDYCGETLLHAASRSIEDNPGIVQELINAGAGIHRIISGLFTPLHYAVICRKRRVVDVLLQSGIFINCKNTYGLTALHYAVNNNHPHIRCRFKISLEITVPDLCIIRKLLDHKLINVDETDGSNKTALMWAIKDKQVEIVKMLLNKNARLDISDLLNQTPLHIALFYRDFHIVAALLLKKASLLKMSGGGKIPLNMIVYSRSFEFSRMCLKIIAFNYNLRGLLTKKMIKLPELLQFMKRCWNEIAHMKSDIIINEFTVFDFFCKYGAKSGFDNPILQIYKPVIQKLVTGQYPEYFLYILNRISKSTLFAVFEVTINVKYCNNNCIAEEYSDEFSKIIRLGLLSEYLSCLDIFCLIAAFTNLKNADSMRKFRGHEWYLTDLWDEYPDKHFY